LASREKDLGIRKAYKRWNPILKGVDYIENNGLERVTSIGVLLLLLMQMSVRTELYSSSATLPTFRPDAAGRPHLHFGSYGVHDFTKELVSPLY
jgi:hypothetical protein